MSRKPRLLIVGGGIAGLTLASTLDPRRFEVVVCEAEPDRIGGAGAALGLWPAAKRALRSLGAAFPTVRTALPQAALRDLDGRPLLRVSAPDLTLLPRPSLMAAIEATVGSHVIREVGEITAPQDLRADLVVGADGVRSVVRQVVSPSAHARRATPWIALRGLIDSPPGADEIGEYWGPGRLFGITPLGPDRTYWFTSFRSHLGPEPIDLNVALTQAAEEFAGTAPVLQRILATAAPDTAAKRLWLAPPLRRYARGRYVVIGDAAHATLPNLGRGANDAILDAVSLGRALNRSGLGGGALTLWQARRLPPTQAAHVGARAMMEFATSRAMARFAGMIPTPRVR